MGRKRQYYIADFEIISPQFIPSEVRVLLLDIIINLVYYIRGSSQLLLQFRKRSCTIMNSPKQFTELTMIYVSIALVASGLFAMVYPVTLGIIGFAKSFATTVAN